MKQDPSYNIGIKYRGITYRIAKIVFSEGRRGSDLIIAFPRQAKQETIVGIFNQTDFVNGEHNLNQSGKITLSGAKFIHHDSGEVHFSQDGKINTTIKKKFIPLLDYEGIIAKIHVKGTNWLDLLKTKTKDNERIMDVGNNDSGLKLLFHWHQYDPSEIDYLLHVDPKNPVSWHDRTIKHGFFLGVPPGWKARNHLLFIEFMEDKIQSNDSEYLLFLGGMDDQSALYLKSPISNASELAKEIGSIDR